MTAEHVHGPECIGAKILGPFNSPPALVLVLTMDDLDNGATGLVESRIPAELLPRVLRVLADKFERANKAKLS